MSQEPRQSGLPRENAPPEKQRGRFSTALDGVPFLLRLRAWTAVHWTRSAAVAGVILLLIAMTVGAWAYLASVALRGGQVRLETALAALDDGNHAHARDLVSQMLSGGYLSRSEYGGPLFVLGVVKVNDAETNSSPDKRRSDYLVASRYLKEARAFGIPSDRDIEALYLLGKSLVESNQFEEGIGVLDDLLAELPEDAREYAIACHHLLAETCLWMPSPNLTKALHHIDAVLADESLLAIDRGEILVLRAAVLSRLGNFELARQSLALVPDGEVAALVQLTKSEIAIAETDSTLSKSATHERTALLSEARPTIEEAMQLLQQAKALDPQHGPVTRQCEYYLGRGWDLLQDPESALRQFSRCRQLYGGTLEGAAASLAEADLLRRRGEFPAALIAYRRVLESLSNPESYRSLIIPLESIRQSLLEALADFVDHQRFDEGLSLLGHFTPLFSRTEQLEFRGATLQRWGDLQLNQSAAAGPESEAVRREGRLHLREAGLAYQQLAALRFATPSYTNDLWVSAENYFNGHNFSRCVLLLKEYLQNEPELRTAQALLRLGQAQLALSRIPESISAFEECIEFYPLDSSTYQARIDCAKAYWHRADTAKAEQLLRDNIAGSTLKPSSREWKDSLFALGMLLHEVGKYEDAIGTLEEAVDRYPNDPQKLLAQFIIGESYRRSAESLLDRVRDSRTSSERDKSLEFATASLNAALGNFELVQRSIALRTHDIQDDPLMGPMRRNCYMCAGTVLFDLGRYQDAITAFSNVASLYPDDPYVVEAFVQIANCWRRLNRSDNARGQIQQAQIALEKLPANADFASATAFSRDEWRMLLSDMSRW